MKSRRSQPGRQAHLHSLGCISEALSIGIWTQRTFSAGLVRKPTADDLLLWERGRFCLSATDNGASKEVTARKTRLGGAAQITIAKYPRVVYAVSVKLERVLDLSGLPSSPILAAPQATWLRENDLAPSMDLGRHLQKAGVSKAWFFQALSPVAMTI
jgi:hypothetical protein